MNRYLSMTLMTSALILGASCLNRGSQTPDLARGRYLVERVGLCHDCHTPRDDKGQPIMAKHLQGAVLPFQPTVPMPWASTSIPIAGLPTLSDEQAVRYLSEGVLPHGRQARPPMPPYRFDPADAKAVVAYLRSLSPTTP